MLPAHVKGCANRFFKDKGDRMAEEKEANCFLKPGFCFDQRKIDKMILEYVPTY